jgi:hypothetical protein
VAHALPIAYLLRALDGEPPAARMDLPVEYASAYPFDAASLARAVAILEAWCVDPTW